MLSFENTIPDRYYWIYPKSDTKLVLLARRLLGNEFFVAHPLNVVFESSKVEVIREIESPPPLPFEPGWYWVRSNSRYTIGEDNPWIIAYCAAADRVYTRGRMNNPSINYEIGDPVPIPEKYR